MKSLLMATGLAVVLMAPVTSNAQQGRQQTDDQANFSNSVKALPNTAKRHHILRSELSTRTNRGHKSMGSGY